MSAWILLVRRSLAQHKLSTAVTVIATALACGLVLSVFAIANQTQRSFTSTDVGYDAVLGPRGAELQIVLSSVYHLETSPDNIPFSIYQTLKQDRRVQLAIPYGLGDNYHGFRLVGTSEEIFTAFEYRNGRKLEFAAGGPFDGQRREAVVGSFAAAQTGLRVGDEINAFHGLNFDPALEHDEVYVITGILEPTNTPNDRVIWIPLEGIWRMKGHVLRGAGEEYVAKPGVPIPDQHKMVSAVMVKLRNRIFGQQIKMDVNRQGDIATFVWPIDKVMLDLFDKLFWFVVILRYVAYMVVAVAVGAILASIYNTMNERRREFAILRSLGASRSTVFGAIVLEAATIAALGALLGFAVYAAVLGAASVILREKTGVVLDVLAPDPILWMAPLGMVLLGAVAGLLPARKAYATDVASNL